MKWTRATFALVCGDKVYVYLFGLCIKTHIERENEWTMAYFQYHFVVLINKWKINYENDSHKAQLLDQ